MQVKNTEEAYGAVLIALHWLTACLVAAAWTAGNFVHDLPAAWRPRDVTLHMMVGQTVFVLSAVRLAWRQFDKPPPPEAPTGAPWIAKAARLGHLFLYLLLFAAPIAGITMQFARGQALPVLGLFDIPPPWVKNVALARDLRELHETVANLLLITALFHAVIALAHHWLLHDRTLARMWPSIGR